MTIDGLEALVAENVRLLSRHALQPAPHPMELALAEHVRHMVAPLLRGGHAEATLGSRYPQCHLVILEAWTGPWLMSLMSKCGQMTWTAVAGQTKRRSAIPELETAFNSPPPPPSWPYRGDREGLPFVLHRTNWESRGVGSRSWRQGSVWGRNFTCTNLDFPSHNRQKIRRTVSTRPACQYA